MVKEYFQTSKWHQMKQRVVDFNLKSFHDKIYTVNKTELIHQLLQLSSTKSNKKKKSNCSTSARNKDVCSIKGRVSSHFHSCSLMNAYFRSEKSSACHWGVINNTRGRPDPGTGHPSHPSAVGGNTCVSCRMEESNRRVLTERTRRLGTGRNHAFPSVFNIHRAR